jgi:hypothetical protein
LNAELPPSITRRVIESSDDYVVSRVRASASSETTQNPASVVMDSDKKSDSSVVFYEEREVKSNRPRVINAETQQGSSEGEVVRKVSAPPAVRTVEITPTTSTTDDSTSKITERTKQASAQAPKVKASESAMGEFSLESQGGVPVKTVTKIKTEAETFDGITSKITFGKQSEDVATKAVFSKIDEGSSGEITLSKGDGSSMSQEFTVVGKVGQKKEAKQQTKEELPNDMSIDIDELLETPDTEIASEKSLEYLGVPWASLHWIKKIEFINTVEDLKILKELQSKSDLSKAVKSALEKRIELVSSPVQV